MRHFRLDTSRLFTCVVNGYARKKHARLKPKLPTLNEELIVFPFLIFMYPYTNQMPKNNNTSF